MLCGLTWKVVNLTFPLMDTQIINLKQNKIFSCIIVYVRKLTIQTWQPYEISFILWHMQNCFRSTWTKWSLCNQTISTSLGRNCYPVPTWDIYWWWYLLMHLLDRKSLNQMCNLLFAEYITRYNNRKVYWRRTCFPLRKTKYFLLNKSHS